jgi:hypothetical protein
MTFIACGVLRLNQSFAENLMPHYVRPPKNGEKTARDIPYDAFLDSLQVVSATGT